VSLEHIFKGGKDFSTFLFKNLFFCSKVNKKGQFEEDEQHT
jgi:hypothetical protein